MWYIIDLFCVFSEPKGSSGSVSSGGGSSAPVQPVGGLFQGGVPKLRPVGGVLFVKHLFKGIANPEIEMVCAPFVVCHILLVHKKENSKDLYFTHN